MEEIITARKMLSLGCFKQAFQSYLVAFHKWPLVKSRYEIEFRTVLIYLNEILSAVNNRDEIMSNLECAVNLFPDNVAILNDIGKYMFKYGYLDEALTHFERAYNSEDTYVCVEKNLNNAKSVMFPRQIYKVLNDYKKNRAFRRAIKSTLIPHQDRVLNINACTGLLALYANECHPMSTTLCESSNTMSRLTEAILKENNVFDIKLMDKEFQALNEVDIYGRHTLLLTDMFDSGLFGSFILQILTNAWDHLLESNARVLPGRAEFYVVGAKCDRLSKKHRLHTDMKETLGIPMWNVHSTTYHGETYYGEDVHLYDELEYVTGDQLLLKINFNNYNDILLKIFKRDPYYVTLTGTQNEDMNLVIGWFKLYLTEDIVITTNPRDPNRSASWQQAVFLDHVPRHVRKSEEVYLHFINHFGMLAVLPERTITNVSAEIVTFLNDHEYIKAIEDMISVVSVHLAQVIEPSEQEILDLSPFPIFGLFMMKRESKSLTCVAKTKCDIEFIKAVLEINGISLTKLTILDYQNMSLSSFEEKRYHAIFCDIFDMSGDIDLKKKRLSRYLRSFHLCWRGLFLPYKTRLMVQLVNSKRLESGNRLSDRAVGGYRLATHVNRYELTQVSYIDLHVLQFLEISAACTIDVSMETLRPMELEIPVIADGNINAVLCNYTVQLMPDIEELSTDRCNSWVLTTAFLANPSVKVDNGDKVTVLLDTDHDGSFRLLINNVYSGDDDEEGDNDE